MTLFKQIMSAIVLVFLLGDVYAQANDPYLGEYRKDALAHEQYVKIAENKVEIRHKNYKAAAADLLPKISASADYWYIQNPLLMTLPDDNRLGELSGMSLGQGANNQYGLYTTLTQPIYRGGMLKEKQKRAEVRERMSYDELQITKQDIVLATDLQYWQSVAQKELVYAMYNYRDDLTRISNLVAHKVEVGTLNKSDYLMTEVRVNRAELAVIQAENDLKIYSMSLNRLLGKEFEEALPLSDSIVLETFFVPTLDQKVRPEYTLAEHKLKSSIHELNMVKSTYKMQLSGVATGSYSSPGYDFTPGALPNIQLGMTLSIPIYQGRKKHQIIGAQQIRLQNRELELERTQEILNLEIAQKKVAWQNSIKETDLAKTSVDKAKENALAMEERFDEGMIDILEVIDSQLYLEQAVIEFIQSKLKTQVQWTHYLRAMGHLSIN
ncbi:TolC family protein [Flammeovirga kamogawensis]|uniref:TolC family protein n=1 Tax=Flammeovirga kamogawensis TaxID=373891 RepID=A0ABX8H319_9BACT|nr:TolC family protein [Flammeovirga kamogawensis]MBB6460231.1 outer membrane protein TolC [Flammeovirga kamogawensis]QWG10043.1 TolC family protein [Flammeovirga kamogawensis]TRX65550.1 TolC family protein [Flammeovirga kamogawensis]